MQSETGFPSSHQLKPYVASKSRLKLAARAVLSADAGLLVNSKVTLQSFLCMHLDHVKENKAGVVLTNVRIMVTNMQPDQR